MVALHDRVQDPQQVPHAHVPCVICEDLKEYLPGPVVPDAKPACSAGGLDDRNEAPSPETIYAVPSEDHGMQRMHPT